MQSWYLIYCKRGQLLRAQEHLTRQQVQCFTPLYVGEKLVRGKRKQVEEPLFPNYLFIHFDPEQIHTTTIHSTRGVSHFVRFGQRYATLTDAVIQQLQEYDTHLFQQANTLQAGTKVMITEGIFAGLEAIYREPDGEARSILLLTLLEKEVSYYADNLTFKKLD